MKNYIALILFSLSVTQHDTQPKPCTVIPCTVLSVYDGDTVIVKWEQTARVRLLDCWAPEVRGASKQDGFKARDFLSDFAESKQGVLEIPWNEDIGKSTSLGRVLGYVWVDGVNLSTYMVESGLATKTKE